MVAVVIVSIQKEYTNLGFVETKTSIRTDILGYYRFPCHAMDMLGPLLSCPGLGQWNE